MTGSKRRRQSEIKWVRIGDMKVSPKAQREFRPNHAADLAGRFNLDAIGYPVVDHRDGAYWIVDGQHRVAALKMVGFTADDQIECEVFEGLTEAQEADVFLHRDARKKVGTFDGFRIAVIAGRDDETQIERIVERAGFKISRDATDGCIGAVSALRYVHGLSPATLGRTLEILGEAFRGDRDSFGANVLKGAGLVAQRYNGEITEQHVERLREVGTTKLRRRAEQLKLKTGHTMANCTAGAIVDAMNGGRGGEKLESWWQ